MAGHGLQMRQTVRRGRGGALSLPGGVMRPQSGSGAKNSGRRAEAARARCIWLIWNGLTGRAEQSAIALRLVMR